MSPQAQILFTGAIEVVIALALGGCAYWSWKRRANARLAAAASKTSEFEQEKKNNVDLMNELTRLICEHTRSVEVFQSFLESSVAQTAASAGANSNVASQVQMMRAANGRFDQVAERKSAELSMAAGKYPSVFGDVSVSFVDHRRNANTFDGVLEQAPSDATPVQLQAITEDTLRNVFETRERLEAKLAAAQREIEQQAARLRAAELDARVDPLTRLGNRRALDEHLVTVHALNERNGLSYSLLMLDIDKFKSINDTYGHAAGDAVLQVMGKVLQTQLRLSDRPFRMGGEEFVMILSATSLKQAAIVAERVRKRVEAATVHFEGKTLHFTASIGVAEIEAGQSSGELLERADEALYAAKNAGRNCVEIALDLNSNAEEISADAVV